VACSGMPKLSDQQMGKLRQLWNGDFGESSS
jgi:hypothetical protein